MQRISKGKPGQMKTNALFTTAIIALLLCLGCRTITADAAGGESRLFQGELQVIIADDFKRQTAETHYHLISAQDGAILRLIFLNMPPEPPLPSGTRVEIRGRLIKGQLRVETLQVLCK